MIHKAVAVGPLQCNCHILADQASKEAVIVDPGRDADEILERVKGYKVLALLHTHCHFDHMTATRKVSEATGAEILIHESDKAYYDSLAKQYQMFRMPSGRRPAAGEAVPQGRGRIDFGKHALKVLHTPGHTQGSCCFHTEGMLLSGDTLFQRSHRPDRPPGRKSEQELESIRTKLYTLDPETTVYPGHGDPTSIAEERAENPFVTG
jgi:glyoxylase-like metal-dependent hydrolase (beta-lactamase superfamily II)